MGLIEDVNTAVIERLRAHPLLADKVYVAEAGGEGDLEQQTPLELPYVMVFQDNGQRTSNMLVQDQEMAYFNFTVHVAGETSQQINAMEDLVYEQWLAWRPIIAGYRFFKMIANFTTPDNTNNAVKPPILYRVDEWGLRLVKGKAVP